jgi:hypothetical protein
MIKTLCFAITFLAILPAFAQKPTNYQSPIHHQVDPLNSYHRVIAVVPYVGSGKSGDPKRPKYAPLPSETVAGSLASEAATTTTAASAANPHSGIIAFTHLPSDDGKMAIVEFVSTDRASLMPILSDKSIQSFEKGVASPTAILTVIEGFKKNFTLDHFGMAAR